MVAEIERLKAEVDGMKRLLWLRHGCSTAALYGDDGEMQCGNCGADFKRDSADTIKARFQFQNQRASNEQN
jgi:hypothetical protein